MPFDGAKAIHTLDAEVSANLRLSSPRGGYWWKAKICIIKLP